jgi:broad specificity phosphatase PhoE
MELYILRHGQSSNNALHDERQRHSDAPLTDLGVRQSEALAQHLAHAHPDPDIAHYESGRTQQRDGQGFGITKLYCSPMQRALQTALPISEALGIAPEVWVDLHEHGGIYLDHGDGRGNVGYPGKTRAEVAAEFPTYILPGDLTERGWWNRAYESMGVCYTRAAQVANRLRRWAEGDFRRERIALVTHGTFINCLLNMLLPQGTDESHFFWHYNTAITRLDFVNRWVVVRYLNRIDHLPPELVT